MLQEKGKAPLISSFMSMAQSAIADSTSRLMTDKHLVLIFANHKQFNQNLGPALKTYFSALEQFCEKYDSP